MVYLAHLDGFGVQFEAVFGDQEFLDIFSLVTLELNDLSHLTISYDSTIAGELLLDDLEDFLLIKLLGETLDSSQSLTTIALLDSDVDIILALLFLSRTLIVVGLREGVCSISVSNCSREEVSVVAAVVAIGLERGAWALTKGFEVFDS